MGHGKGVAVSAIVGADMKAPDPVPPGPDEDWLRLKDVFEGARALPADSRPAYLAAACYDNPALRQEVELLLASHERARTFLETPVMLFDDKTTRSGRTICHAYRS